jgi:F-type H+-transporting ATPase subunit delta
MAENVTLARPYAEAAFRVARDSGGLEAWHQLLARMAVVADDSDVRALLDNPNVDVATVTRLFVDVCTPDAPAEQKNFVQLLAENNRLGVTAEIRDLFDALKNDVEGVKDAQIVSAFPLQGTALSDLVVDLERRFKCKIQATVAVDPDLIGGVRIAVGDQVIDASVRGKLAQLATALKN